MRVLPSDRHARLDRRYAHRSHPRLQPLLHAPHRRAAGRTAGDAAFTLTESRLLWELAHRDGGHRQRAGPRARARPRLPEPAAARLQGTAGWSRRTRDPDDARHLRLRLTAEGRRAFAPLDTRSRTEVGALLGRLADAAAAPAAGGDGGSIEQLLGGAALPRAEPWLLRPHRAGDIGWVIGRHGALYAQEYGWDLALRGAGRAASRPTSSSASTPAREACWIAERDARQRRLRLPGAGARRDERCAARGRGAAAAAAGRAVGARARHRRAPGRRVRALRAPGRLSHASCCGPTACCVAARGIYAKAGYRLVSERAAPQLRPRPRRRDLGAGARRTGPAPAGVATGSREARLDRAQGQRRGPLGGARGWRLMRERATRCGGTAVAVAFRRSAAQAAATTVTAPTSIRAGSSTARREHRRKAAVAAVALGRQTEGARAQSSNRKEPALQSS